MVIEGFQHSFQFEQFWIRYRRAATEFECELALYIAHAAPYSGPDAEGPSFNELQPLIKAQTEGWADTVPATQTVNSPSGSPQGLPSGRCC